MSANSLNEKATLTPFDNLCTNFSDKLSNKLNFEKNFLPNTSSLNRFYLPKDVRITRYLTRNRVDEGHRIAKKKINFNNNYNQDDANDGIVVDDDDDNVLVYLSDDEYWMDDEETPIGKNLSDDNPNDKVPKIIRTKEIQKSPFFQLASKDIPAPIFDLPSFEYPDKRTTFTFTDNMERCKHKFKSQLVQIRAGDEAASVYLICEKCSYSITKI